MKPNVIAILKKNGFENCDVNIWDNGMICFHKCMASDEILITHATGEEICYVPNNHYAVIGFLYSLVRTVNI